MPQEMQKNSGPGRFTRKVLKSSWSPSRNHFSHPEGGRYKAWNDPPPSDFSPPCFGEGKSTPNFGPSFESIAIALHHT